MKSAPKLAVIFCVTYNNSRQRERTCTLLLKFCCFNFLPFAAKQWCKSSSILCTYFIRAGCWNSLSIKANPLYNGKLYETYHACHQTQLLMRHLERKYSDCTERRQHHQETEQKVGGVFPRMGLFKWSKLIRMIYREIEKKVSSLRKYSLLCYHRMA